MLSIKGWFLDFLFFPHRQSVVCRGRILGRNWDKGLKSFPPFYSQSPLLTDILPPPPLSKSGLLCKHCIRKPQVLELSRLLTKNLNEIVRSWIRLQICVWGGWGDGEGFFFFLKLTILLIRKEHCEPAPLDPVVCHSMMLTAWLHFLGLYFQSQKIYTSGALYYVVFWGANNLKTIYI
jgi:hypothetical protein